MSAYIFNEAKMFSDIADGIAIVINSETGIYYGMNGFGTAVFENISRGVSAEDLLTALMALPDVPQDMASRLTAFLESLEKFEIVLEGAGNGVVDLDPDVPGKDDFFLVVQEYSDAQELLLADPIHEVKNETGWAPDKDALEEDTDVVKSKYQKMEK
jgi:hypothetical protein